MADEQEVLRCTVSGGVATVLMDRPSALNSVTDAMKQQLKATVARVGADPDVRAVVLTGAGRAFCAGQDLREHADRMAAADTSLGTTVQEDYNPIVLGIAQMPKPVIAAVNGVAAGAGASFAFACDFRLAADNASFVMAFARVGLTADSGASWTLPRLIGWARARAMLMLAEPVSAPQALDMGLVNAVVPAADLQAAAAELAGRLAAGPTAAYAAIKESLDFSATNDLRTTLDTEGVLQGRLGRTEDHINATEAFLAKREPIFHGR